MTYEHIGQFLAQVNDTGINDVHKVRLFPLSLFGMIFNWFTSLALNSINTWVGLEERFHEYFYNRETELKLYDLIEVRQKYSETVAEYNKSFRETRNKWYSLTVREWDLADLALVGLSSYLREKLEGVEFVDVNQVMLHAIAQENHARDNQSHSWFIEGSKEKECVGVGLVEDNPDNDDDVEVCVAEWVDTPKGKPVTCPFLKPVPGKKEKMCFYYMYQNVISSSMCCCKTMLSGWKEAMRFPRQSS
jgi:hypothetical protein